jgi:hypothetical protein
MAIMMLPSGARALAAVPLALDVLSADCFSSEEPPHAASQAATPALEPAARIERRETRLTARPDDEVERLNISLSPVRVR